MKSDNNNPKKENWIKPKIEVIDLNKTLDKPSIPTPSEEVQEAFPGTTITGKFADDGPS